MNFLFSLTEPDRRRKQAIRRAQREAQGNVAAAEESESDDEDVRIKIRSLFNELLLQVVVFERVTGRYPGGSTIKDNSIA